MRAPMPNQKLLSRVKLFCMRVEEGLHGWGLYHSYGVNLQHRKGNISEMSFANRQDGTD